MISRVVGAENLCHLGRCLAERSWFWSSVRRRPSRSWPGRKWEDLRLVGLKLIFLIVSRVVSVLGLSRRESWWKDAEILMLRHQLAVAQRERPRAHSRLRWTDRALLALLALLADTLPAERLEAMRLIVTPATILRWHRDIVCRRWARASRRVAPAVRLWVPKTCVTCADALESAAPCPVPGEPVSGGQDVR
jgi:hypothetical protein